MTAVHFSRLKMMARSPAHYAAYEEFEATGPMRFGSAVHSLVLGGDLIKYDGERSGNAWKAFKAYVDGEACYVYDGPHRGKAWEAAKAQAVGRPIITTADTETGAEGRATQARRRAKGLYDAVIVSASEYDQARRCADAVLSDRRAMDLISGETEVPFEWEVAGRACAGHIDVLKPGIVTELKTTSNADPDWFARHAIARAYHAQLAWYAEGARQNGRKVAVHYIVAVEPRAPFAVTCFELTPRAIEEGAKMYRLWMERLAVCEASDDWPGYAQSVVPLDVDAEFELTFGDEVAA